MLVIGLILLVVGLGLRYLLNDNLAVKIGTLLAVVGAGLVVIDVLLLLLGTGELEVDDD